VIAVGLHISFSGVSFYFAGSLARDLLLIYYYISDNKYNAK